VFLLITSLYIDPGTGMIIIQLIVAAFATMVAFSKKVKNKIKNLFKGK
tara:strand:- start:1172 stop:1315 length:144 start_codon:yes stop_codon:yes gene_type:complete